MSVANIINPTSGQIRPEFIPPVPPGPGGQPLPVIGAATTPGWPAGSGSVPITWTGGLAGNVLEANKLYKIDVALQLGATNAVNNLDVVFSAAPSSGLGLGNLGASDIVIGDGGISAGQVVNCWTASGFLQSTTNASIVASWETNYSGGPINTANILTATLTKLN